MTKRLTWVALAMACSACGSTSAGPSGDGGIHDGGGGKDAGHGEGGAGEAGLTAAAACMDRAAAVCALLEKCSPSTLEKRYGDMATCVSNTVVECTNTHAAPSSGQTPSITEACAKVIPTWACDDYLDNTNYPAACVQVKGSLDDGSACAFPGQCKTGFCAVGPNANCGKCAAQPAAGDSCADLANCGQGLACAKKSQTCEPFGKSGAACIAGLPCGAGLSCVGAVTKTGKMGTCMAAISTKGASCDPTQQKGPGCDDSLGLTCNATSSTCQTAVISAGGMPCGTVDGQLAFCAAGGTCSTDVAGDTGKCIAAAASGKTCDVGGPGCVDPERCIGASDAGMSGTCETPSAATCKWEQAARPAIRASSSTLR